MPSTVFALRRAKSSAADSRVALLPASRPDPSPEAVVPARVSVAGSAAGASLDVGASVLGAGSAIGAPGMIEFFPAPISHTLRIDSGIGVQTCATSPSSPLGLAPPARSAGGGDTVAPGLSTEPVARCADDLTGVS